MGEGLTAAPHTPNKHFEVRWIAWNHFGTGDFLTLSLWNFPIFDVFHFNGNKLFNLFKHWQTFILKSIEKCQRNMLCNACPC